MSDTKDGGPAFPVPSPCYDHIQFGEFYGMSLRDAFAIAALQGWAAGRNSPFEAGKSTHPDLIAKSCYAYADAMLEARKP